MKLNPKDLESLAEDLIEVQRIHSNVLAAEPRIARPLKDAVEAAKMRVEQVSEKASSLFASSLFGNNIGLTNAGNHAS
jgi:hypothetical protein